MSHICLEYTRSKISILYSECYPCVLEKAKDKIILPVQQVMVDLLL